MGARETQVHSSELTPLVYEELRKLAQWHMGHERHAHTLQATALVHEAYLRLVDINQIRWQDRAHFFAMAARQMRRILIDAARKRGNQKRGGGVEKVPLTEELVIPDRPEDLVALDEALEALALSILDAGKVVELKVFRRAERRRNRGSAGGLDGYGQTRLETRQGVVETRARRRFARDE